MKAYQKHKQDQHHGMNLIHKRNLQEKEILQSYNSIITVHLKLNDCVLGNTFSPHLNVFNLRISIYES